MLKWPKVEWFTFKRKLDRGECPLDDLGPAQAALSGFSKRTDEEFTRLAQGVSEILRRIRTLGEQTESLAAIVQDRDEARALTHAYEVYKHSVDLVHASMGVALADHEQLAKVEQRLLEACNARGGLEQNSLVFRMVTVETRIEAMRLDHEGQLVFLNVGDAIQHMGTRISETAGSAFGRIEAVVAETRRERENLQTHQLALHEEAQVSVARIRTELDQLRKALEPCALLSADVLVLVHDIQSISNDVVVALQAQDIMRQQLEHVSTGLDEIRSRSSDEALLCQASRVQILQLGSAKERIEKATEALRTALQRLAAKSGELADRFVTMETAMLQAVGDCKLAGLFKEETEKLAQIATQSEQSNTRIAELVTRVDSVIQGFSVEVSAQQFDVKLVALNAQIAAARMEDAGALNRLAEETSSVANRVGEMTDSMTGQLREALHSLQAMKEEADRFQGTIVSDKKQLEEKSVRVNGLLHGLEEGLRQETTEAKKGFELIRSELDAFEHSLTWQAEIDACFGRAADSCRAVLTWCGGEEGNTEEVFRASQVGYTMASEYELHAQALGKAEASAPPADSSSSKDIELF